MLLPAAEAALGLQTASGGAEGERLSTVVGAATRGAWAAVLECRYNARRPAVVTALLDAVLQPSLFDCAAEGTAYRWAGASSGKLPLKLLQQDSQHQIDGPSMNNLILERKFLEPRWVH